MLSGRGSEIAINVAELCIGMGVIVSSEMWLRRYMFTVLHILWVISLCIYTPACLYCVVFLLCVHCVTHLLCNPFKTLYIRMVLYMYIQMSLAKWF